ncbi:MCE family protein [Mycolicibacterium sp. BiH015]|uniref:MCE family protein n=1 Tax=Mycolicibacterium sp. BiH015 TaxID=3018808 RepID=UPI0022DFD108|nr:MCE family protein [Mycolicibacterium sp. BiH015]MDA2894901.1 MCE family protein [Mycolicibacterium sp. BiH015]
MLKYKGRQLIRAGVIGIVVVALVIVVGLQPERLLSLATDVRYQALFAEAGGLQTGNDVVVSGIKVGHVTSVALDRDRVRVGFTADARVTFGRDSTAHIRTGSLLGERTLTVESIGPGVLDPSTEIPLTRTSSPYSLNDAVGDLSTQIAGTNTADVNQSLDVLAQTLDQIAPQLGPTFEGLTRVSRMLNERNDDIGQLLANSADVTQVLSDRSARVNSLILNANDLMAVLVDRRMAIANLLANTSAVSQQISGLVDDNEAELAPMLTKLNSVNAMLQKNRDNIAAALPGLEKFQRTQGETIASGAYYNAFVANLIPSQFLQPFLDYAFGFRRGVNAGQPPDNAGPRAELPFPVNGIPQPGDLPDDGNP